MIRVKINREIHIRKGPGPSFESLGSIKPSGKVIEMAGWVEGESLKSTNKWFFNINEKKEKQFYWAGGVTVIDEFAAAAPPNSHTTTVSSNSTTALGSYQSKVNEFLARGDFNLHRGSPSFRDWKVSWGHVDLEIWKIWNHSRLPSMGEHVNIAVIDNGAPSNNRNLMVNAADCFYPLNDGGSIVDSSSNMHGCMCVGIVASRGPQIFGIAPASNIFIARTYQADGTLSLEALRDSIRWAIDKNCDIISMSFTINQIAEDKIKLANQIRQELARCKEKKILVTCAIGNSGMLNRPMEDVFPACDPPCISVGGYQLDTLKRYKTTTPSHHLKFLLPADAVLTTTLTGTDFIGKDSSIATPAFAGILALFISLKKTGKISINHDDLLQRLHDTGKKVTEQIGNSEYQYTIPQPLDLLNKL